MDMELVISSPPVSMSVTVARMPSSTLILFLVGLGSLINRFKQKRGTLFHPRLLGNLGGRPEAHLNRARGGLEANTLLQGEGIPII